MELRQVARILRRRWKFVFVTFMVGLLGAGAITSVLLTPTYKSDARIYVTATAATSVDAYAIGLYSQQRIASYADLATDPNLLERVIRRVGLNISAEQLAPHVTATPVPSSVVLQISVTDKDPRVAQQLAQAEASEVVKLVDTLEAPSKGSKEAGVTNIAPVIARLAGDATFDPASVSPHLALNLIIGAVLGLLFGISGAVLRDVFDTSIKSPEDATAASGAPLMAVIPYDSSVPKKPLISDSGGSDERVDAFSVLRTNLQFVDLDAKHQIIIVSSALPDEGKTVTATNLAITLAKTSRRVLVVDCDFRKPRVARILGLENSVGLLSVLVGHASLEDCIQQHSSGCDLLATGPLPPNPAEVLETQAMSDLLSRMRDLYDVVIIDAPPLLPVADPAIVASKADGVLLVVRHGKTSVEAVENAVGRIDTVGAEVLGVVLNMAPRRAMADYGYGYGYGYGEASTWSQNNANTKGRPPKQGGRRVRKYDPPREVIGRAR